MASSAVPAISTGIGARDLGELRGTNDRYRGMVTWDETLREALGRKRLPPMIQADDVEDKGAA